MIHLCQALKQVLHILDAHATTSLHFLRLCRGGSASQFSGIIISSKKRKKRNEMKRKGEEGKEKEERTENNDTLPSVIPDVVFVTLI